MPLCLVCNKRAYSQYCVAHKPRKAIATNKRPNQRGKHWTKWVITRDMWFKQNKAESYTCYLCGKIMTKAETTLDHIIPRSRDPKLRYDFTNLQPCCYKCNSKKGSKVSG